jgi:hypothetical protein
LIEPKQTGTFAIEYRGKSHKWRLPLVALLPPMVDAKSGEEFPGNYLFNPFTGEKLTDAVAMP